VYHEFKILSQQKQLSLIRVKGVFLMSYKQYNVVIRLFQVDGYYAEIFSFDEDGKIAMINAFEDMKYLDPYLERMDVSLLING
jgi:hypothetical protein